MVFMAKREKLKKKDSLSLSASEFLHLKILKQHQFLLPWILLSCTGLSCLRAGDEEFWKVIKNESYVDQIRDRLKMNHQYQLMYFTCL